MWSDKRNSCIKKENIGYPSSAVPLFLLTRIYSHVSPHTVLKLINCRCQDLWGYTHFTHYLMYSFNSLKRQISGSARYEMIMKIILFWILLKPALCFSSRVSIILMSYEFSIPFTEQLLDRSNSLFLPLINLFYSSI